MKSGSLLFTSESVSEGVVRQTVAVIFSGKIRSDCSRMRELSREALVTPR